jgi:hypothetical protein
VLVLLIVLLVPMFLGIQASPAMACSCMARTSIDNFARAGVVFVGRLTAIDRAPSSLSFSTIDPVIYHFETDTILKGAVPMDVSVRSIMAGTIVGGWTCGLGVMHQGERYTVFARAEGEMLLSGFCEGTHTGGPDPALALVSGLLLGPTPDSPPWSVLFLLGSAAVLAVRVGRARRRA